MKEASSEAKKVTALATSWGGSGRREFGRGSRPFVPADHSRGDDDEEFDEGEGTEMFSGGKGYRHGSGFGLIRNLSLRVWGSFFSL
jgi:hypothetical protein